MKRNTTTTMMSLLLSLTYICVTMKFAYVFLGSVLSFILYDQ